MVLLGVVWLWLCCGKCCSVAAVVWFGEHFGDCGLMVDEVV